MEQNSFYLTLPSNVQSSPTNSLTNYFTILPHRISLDGEWRVALTEISYTKSWYNIVEDEQIYCYSDDMRAFSDKNGVPVILKKGYYDTEDLIFEINKLLGKVHVINKPFLEEKHKPYLVHNINTNKVSLKKGEDDNGNAIHAFLSVSLREILGFKKHIYSHKSLLLKKKFSVEYNIEGNIVSSVEVAEDIGEEADSHIDIDRGIRSIFLYSDIVHPVRVGDSQVQLLRVVEIPENVGFGKQCVIKYDRPYYHPIITQDFNSIRVYIKDDAGSDIPFEFGRVIVTLHFKKWSNTI